jgi:hypothetical protein
VAEAMNEEKRRAELVRLLERDYDQTSEFIRSIVGTTSTTRGWAVTVWLAVLGFAIQQNQVALALLGSLVLAPFWLLDAYHSWLYGQALRHARGLEELAAAYYRAVESGEDDEALWPDLDAELAAHRFGLYSHFRRFQLPEIVSARPQVVFRYFYPGLFLSGLIAALLIALLN